MPRSVLTEQSYDRLSLLGKIYTYRCLKHPRFTTDLSPVSRLAPRTIRSTCLCSSWEQRDINRIFVGVLAILSFFFLVFQKSHLPPLIYRRKLVVKRTEPSRLWPKLLPSSNIHICVTTFDRSCRSNLISNLPAAHLAGFRQASDSSMIVSPGGLEYTCSETYKCRNRRVYSNSDSV